MHHIILIRIIFQECRNCWIGEEMCTGSIVERGLNVHFVGFLLVLFSPQTRKTNTLILIPSEDTVLKQRNNRPSYLWINMSSCFTRHNPWYNETQSYISELSLATHHRHQTWPTSKPTSITPHNKKSRRPLLALIDGWDSQEALSQIVGWALLLLDGTFDSGFDWCAVSSYNSQGGSCLHRCIECIM